MSIRTTTGLLQGSAGLPLALDWLESAPAVNAYGRPSSGLRVGEPVAGHRLMVLARHGVPHRIAPAAINYRANLRALADAGVERIVAFHTVGGIEPALTPGTLVLPDQLIDYTSGREDSFHEPHAVVHRDFSQPFDRSLQDRLHRAASTAQLHLVQGGVYGCTQGPRLETAAEIVRMGRDGCTLVGMTLMPEAFLARELGIPYVSVCLVVNPAAGVATETLDLDGMLAIAREGERAFQALLLPFLQSFVEAY